MKISKRTLIEWIENEFCNSCDDDTEITPGLIEEICCRVLDWEREDDPDLHYDFRINDKFFSDIVKMLKTSGED